jgi:hypothetical protein
VLSWHALVHARLVLASCLASFSSAVDPWYLHVCGSKEVAIEGKLNAQDAEYSAVLQLLDSFFLYHHPTSIKAILPFNNSKNFTL